ncbi:hypothetical protein F5X96DRAFT_664797 [Biscogniauxia mediterranea]|nr:hypothetical protein F5X96DRAFT_664797 [Biscogniauxia mediterranea]
MLLKRKRSESELSFSSSSGLGSPSKHDITMDMGGLRIVTPAHLPSRTMKRFRDSRPSDEEVHRKFLEWRAHHLHHSSPLLLQSSSFSPNTHAERTLNMLYTAQKQQQDHHHHQPTSAFTMSCPQPAAPFTRAASPAAPSQGAQASLHKFWNLPNPSPLSNNASPASPPVDRSIYAPTNCEDCGQGLGGVDGSADDNAMMDVDSFDVGVDTACSGCGKHVCSHCSITNLGEQRRCLICAGRKVWVGGLGWTTSAGVPVC